MFCYIKTCETWKLHLSFFSNFWNYLHHVSQKPTQPPQNLILQIQQYNSTPVILLQPRFLSKTVQRHRVNRHEKSPAFDFVLECKPAPPSDSASSGLKPLQQSVSFLFSYFSKLSFLLGFQLKAKTTQECKKTTRNLFLRRLWTFKEYSELFCLL